MYKEVIDNSDVFKSIPKSYWLVSFKREEYPKLESNIAVDVAIVGGGIVGITSALLLKDKGYKVAILEADRIFHGTTGHSTAKVTSQHNLIYDKLMREFGEIKAKQYAEANECAISFIANIIKERNIDCDFCRCPAYVFTQSEDYIDKIEKEVKAASSLGIKASYEDKPPLPFTVKAAVRFENQAQFHPARYMQALAKAIPGDGSYIFESTKVTDIHEDEKENCTVIVHNGCKISAHKVIIASHFPCYDGLGMYFARMYAEKSYVIALKLKESFQGGMFISAEEPGRSLRSQKCNEEELVLVGGEHHKTGSHTNTNIHYENLINFAKEIFEVESILYRWSTQDCMTIDGVPYVGYLTSKTKSILVATGFGKWGMTNGTAAAKLLTDLIVKGDSPWREVYNPSRFDIMISGGKLISQNLDVAGKFIGGKLDPVPKEIKVDKGEAKIVSINGERIGVYCDEDGKYHCVDITCTHLGCELIWNEAEKTWDCPCHGSRFSYEGDNIEGPAFIPLKKLGEGSNEKDPNIF